MNIETNRFAGTGSVTAGSRPVEVQKTTAGAGHAPNVPLTVSVTAGHPFAQQVDAATEADLRRDDPLGRLVDRAMNLPPPPIPEGLKG